MKTLVFMLAALPSLALSQSFVKPVLSANQVTEIASKYIDSEKEIDLDNYTLESVSFTYFENRLKTNYWYVTYWGKPNGDGSVTLGNHFSVRLTNSEKPEIEFIAGL